MRPLNIGKQSKSLSTQNSLLLHQIIIQLSYLNKQFNLLKRIMIIPLLHKNYSRNIGIIKQRINRLAHNLSAISNRRHKASSKIINVEYVISLSSLNFKAIQWRALFK